MHCILRQLGYIHISLELALRLQTGKLVECGRKLEGWLVPTPLWQYTM